MSVSTTVSRTLPLAHTPVRCTVCQGSWWTESKQITVSVRFRELSGHSRLLNVDRHRHDVPDWDSCLVEVRLGIV